MTPFAAKANPPEILRTFFKIKLVMENLPEIELPENVEVSCHMITRALERFFKVEYKDGYFSYVGWQHSWLVTKEGNIIDPYPVAAIGGPLFLDINLRFSPWTGLYTEANLERSFNGETFKKSTEIVVRAIAMTIDRLRAQRVPIPTK